MSKAFFREDTVPEDEVIALPVRILPPGLKNLMTRGGAGALRAELQKNLEQRKPLSHSDSPEKRVQLAVVDHRIRHLQVSLESAEIIEPAPVADGTVGFGAIVTVVDQGGEPATYQIVGVDEAAPEKNRISWLSPLAKALQDGRLGETVSFQAGRRIIELRLTEIRYA